MPPLCEPGTGWPRASTLSAALFRRTPSCSGDARRPASLVRADLRSLPSSPVLWSSSIMSTFFSALRAPICMSKNISDAILPLRRIPPGADCCTLRRPLCNGSADTPLQSGSVRTVRLLRPQRRCGPPARPRVSKGEARRASAAATGGFCSLGGRDSKGDRPSISGAAPRRAENSRRSARESRSGRCRGPPRVRRVNTMSPSHCLFDWLTADSPLQASMFLSVLPQSKRALC